MSIEQIDFNALYMDQKQKSSFKMKSKEDWDKKSEGMNKRVHHSIYNEAFLSRLDLLDIESVLDVGCGVGNLSLPLSKKVKEVNALDYSAGMLKTLQTNAKEQGISNIHTFECSWYDAWDQIPQADLVIASRSMEVKDMKEALLKLDSQALKKVVLSFKVGGSFLSDEILKVMQREVLKKPDYIYVINILYSLGINARLDFIPSEGRATQYNSLESFLQSVAWSIGELSLDEKERLTLYYNEQLKDKTERIEPVFWAMISWDKEGLS